MRYVYCSTYEITAAPEVQAKTLSYVDNYVVISKTLWLEDDKSYVKHQITIQCLLNSGKNMGYENGRHCLETRQGLNRTNIKVMQYTLHAYSTEQK